MKKIILIFILALIIRFLYFPDNIYFGYDQARDAYEASLILKGDLKVTGPTTSFVGLNHGVLYYYILAPLLLLDHSPEFIAAVWRIFNALGLILVFYLSKSLFDKKVAMIAAFYFAISFEQSQFAIFLHHPSLGVLSVLIMYFGLALAIFSKKSYGLILAFLGLGLSIQFEFPLIYLIIPFSALILIFRKSFLNIPLKTYELSILVFLISISSFIVAEIKNNFRSVNSLLALSNFNSSKTLESIFNTYFYTVSKMVEFNLGSVPLLIIILILITLVVGRLYFKDKIKELLFLGIWFVGILTTFIINGGSGDLEKNTPLYYPNVGVSISLLIFMAFITQRLWQRNIFLALILIAFITYYNLSQIININPKGPIPQLTVQQGMLLSDEKKVLDFIYQDALGKPIAVKAITMPLDINTTWSYLFEWYGKNKYGYLPIWNGKNAEGYPGGLIVQEAQEGLPSDRYVIIEPTRGIRFGLIEDALRLEGYFTNIVEEKKIGEFTVQKRVKY